MWHLLMLWIITSAHTLVQGNVKISSMKGKSTLLQDF
jgi:hypothetical protein